MMVLGSSVPTVTHSFDRRSSPRTDLARPDAMESQDLSRRHGLQGPCSRDS